MPKPYYHKKSGRRKRAIKNDPSYAVMLCRCETVTEGDVLNAIHRPIKAHTVDMVKRRTRAGMGRCQGAYCRERVAELIARELKIDISEVKVRLADVVSVMNASYITYGQSFADDVKMIDVVEECASYCYDLLRSENLFTHNISLPQAKMYRVHNTSNVLDSAIVLIPELYVQN